MKTPSLTFVRFAALATRKFTSITKGNTESVNYCKEIDRIIDQGLNRLKRAKTQEYRDKTLAILISILNLDEKYLTDRIKALEQDQDQAACYKTALTRVSIVKAWCLTRISKPNILHALMTSETWFDQIMPADDREGMTRLDDDIDSVLDLPDLEIRLPDLTRLNLDVSLSDFSDLNSTLDLSDLEQTITDLDTVFDLDP